MTEKQQQLEKDERRVRIERAKIVDEFGLLDQQLAAHKQSIKRLADLGKLIRDWHKDLDPELTYSAKGQSFEVSVGVAEMETHFAGMKVIFDLLGEKKFLAVAHLTLKSLGTQLDPLGVASVTHKERTGSRKLIATELKRRAVKAAVDATISLEKLGRRVNQPR
jgi:hypothetical protein